MDTLQIENILHCLLGDGFCGVWAADQLPLLNSSFRLPAYFIVNTHPAHMPGEHWLALTLEKNNGATFFDSYGFSPVTDHYPSSILQFLEKRSENIMYHDRQLQHILSNVCGHHCIFYLCHRACGLSLDNVLSMYSDDVLKNDDMVYNFVRKYQRCVKNKDHATSKQGSCSLQLFKDCYKF